MSIRNQIWRIKEEVVNCWNITEQTGSTRDTVSSTTAKVAVRSPENSHLWMKTGPAAKTAHAATISREYHDKFQWKIYECCLPYFYDHSLS